MESVDQDAGIALRSSASSATAASESSYDGDDEGGAKRFTYNGTTKKTSLFDGDDDLNYNHRWNFKNQQNSNKPGQFDLDDVWSIKKNVNVSKSPVVNPAGGSFWEREAGKGYYSRHGGLSDDDSRTHNSAMTNGPGRTYGQASNKTYSYSYANPTADALSAPVATNGTSPRGTVALGGGGQARTSPNGGMNTGLSNGGPMSNGHSPPRMAPYSRHGGPVSNRYQGPMANHPPRKS